MYNAQPGKAEKIDQTASIGQLMSLLHKSLAMG